MAIHRQLLSVFTLFITLASAAQDTQFFYFVITDQQGNPIHNAKLIVLNGEEYYTDQSGKVTYYGEKDYVKKDGRYVETRKMPSYITAKAANFKDYKIELGKYRFGSTITIKLKPIPAIMQQMQVYVHDKAGNPVANASVTAVPGKTTTTDANGYAKALHNQIIGEWVTIKVKANGFKMAEQHIPTGDASRQENGVTIPPATAYFTLERGTNETAIININVEVADKETDKRLPGAIVQLKLSDGSTFSGTTNAKGEVMFSDLEYGFQGTSARVIANKTGYKEKWSDLPVELTTGHDNYTRQFLVFLEKNESGAWAGTYTANTGIGVATLTISGSDNSITATISHVKTNGYTDHAQWSGCKVVGNTLTCNWAEAYEDQDKKVARKGTVSLTRTGNTVSGTAIDGDPVTTWKPNISPYTGFYKGFRSALNFTKVD